MRMIYLNGDDLLGDMDSSWPYAPLQCRHLSDPQANIVQSLAPSKNVEASALNQKIIILFAFLSLSLSP